MNPLIKKAAMTAALTASAIFGTNEAGACSRVVYHGLDSLYIVGRSLDWKTPIPTNLYVYPRGITKTSHTLPGAFTWTSRYGAVYAVGYDGGVTEGMNERGLVINGLFCKGTVYDGPNTTGRPPMSLSVFVAWLLDLNATTEEVVKTLQEQDFNISGQTFDGGTVSALHWGITDASGATAILEFDHGKINIYQGSGTDVMTNDPPFPQMLAINNYWKTVGGVNMLPGGVRSPDRYVRASFFNSHVQQTPDADLGLAIVRSIIMNVSVPYTYLIQGEPNVSSTQWRSFADTKNLRYHFDIVTNPGMYYIDLHRCNLRPGAPVMRLDTSKSAAYVGCANSHLAPHPGFKPMY